MYCKYCGNKVQEGSLFCSKCGSRLPKLIDDDIKGTSAEKNQANTTSYQDKISADNTQNADSNQSRTINQNSNQNTHNPSIQQNTTAKKKTKPKLALAIISVGVIMFILATVFGINRKITININDYLNVDFSGYDSKGNAALSIDRNRFISDYQKKLKFKPNKKNLIENDFYGDFANYFGVSYKDDNYYAVLVFLHYIYGELDKTSDLANGDKVTVRCLSTVDIEEYFNCKVEYSDLICEVGGLKELVSFDPFEAMEVMFDGIAPYGRAHTEKINNKDPYSHFKFTIDNDENLSNGDTIIVRVEDKFANEDVSDYCIENFGMKPVETEREYTVEGLATYISSASDISEEYLKKMKEQVEDKIRATAASSWNSAATLEKMDYIGNYFIWPKDKNSTGDKNRFVMVYNLKSYI